MTAFTPDQWVVVGLVFLLGLLLGMYMLAGGKWKRRYKEEARRREELETENKRLLHERSEMDTLRHAAARDEARRSDRTDSLDRRDHLDRGPL
jgi:outer membrane murein-binding lipoprotein Lpp